MPLKLTFVDGYRFRVESGTRNKSQTWAIVSTIIVGTES